MSLELELDVGSDLTLARDNLTIVRKFRMKDKLPYTGGGDCFDTISSRVMDTIRTDYPMYGTPIGTLYWSSIQLHESHYGQLYGVSVTYTMGPGSGGGSGPEAMESGTYMIRFEHSAGTAKATAGTRIAGYPSAKAVDNGGAIWNGQEHVGVDVPYNTTRIVISYRHPQGFLNFSYLNAIGYLVGHPNNDSFLGYEPGEIAYMGGNATETDTEASAEYTFEVSRNVTNLVVGGITINEKKGFDEISPVYKWDTATDGDGDTKAIRPIDYIEIIRPRGRELLNYATVFGWGGQ